MYDEIRCCPWPSSSLQLNAILRVYYLLVSACVLRLVRWAHSVNAFCGIGKRDQGQYTHNKTNAQKQQNIVLNSVVLFSRHFLWLLLNVLSVAHFTNLTTSFEQAYELILRTIDFGGLTTMEIVSFELGLNHEMTRCHIKCLSPSHRCAHSVSSHTTTQIRASKSHCAVLVLSWHH